MSDYPVITVAELNRHVAALIGAQQELASIRIGGELANVKRYRSGHLYFSLRDETATVSCVMFQGNARSLTFEPRDGARVVCDCRAGFFERDGRFQLYINSMQESGLGNLYEEFNRLKNKLTAEGLFNPERKKSLPRFPRKIGVVTSASGAVIRDIIHVASRRWPGIQIVLYPCRVQGPQTAESVARGILYFNKIYSQKQKAPDVIIIGRGGGSMEDLWGFNNERLARTIAISEIPVISAVGHETDFTIADFVADLRAPTPSAAAEVAVPVKAELQEQIRATQSHLKRLLLQRLTTSRLRLDRLCESPYLRQPQEYIALKREIIDRQSERLSRALKQLLQVAGHRLGLAVHSLDALSPLRVLARGYGMVVGTEGKPVTGIAEVEVGGQIRVQMADGALACTVTGKDKRPAEQERRERGENDG